MTAKVLLVGRARQEAGKLGLGVGWAGAQIVEPGAEVQSHSHELLTPLCSGTQYTQPHGVVVMLTAVNILKNWGLCLAQSKYK